MKLLVFAHKKEAEAFFKNINFELVPFYFEGLYKSLDYFLLITGEGLQSASEKMMAALTALKERNISIREIINLGVAGSVNPKIKVGSIIEIRTSYAHHFERLEFKSFTSKKLSLHHDCMSVFDRVTSIEERKKMAMFADIIDRELWAIGSSANLFKIPFRSMKYISDDLESTHFCQLVIENAGAISFELYQYFLADLNNSTAPKKETNHRDLFFQNKNFHFTVTHKRKLEHLFTQLENKNIALNELYLKNSVQSILLKEITPKERTRDLINLIIEIINPMHLKIYEKVDELIAPLKKKNIDIQYDRELENENLLFSFKIKSDEELQLILKDLQSFNFSKLQEIFIGKFDV